MASVLAISAGSVDLDAAAVAASVVVVACGCWCCCAACAFKRFMHFLHMHASGLIPGCLVLSQFSTEAGWVYLASRGVSWHTKQGPHSLPGCNCVPKFGRPIFGHGVAGHLPAFQTL